MTEFEYGHKEPEKKDRRGLNASVDHVPENVDQTIWAKFQGASQNIQVEKERNLQKSKIKHLTFSIL